MTQLIWGGFGVGENSLARNLSQSDINTLNQIMTVSFSTRPKAEIDDLVAFFESLGGVSRFKFNLEDSNEGSSTETILCVCDSWNQRWAYDDFYTLTTTFRRVYES